MSGGRASPFRLNRKQADSSDRRSNTIHRAVYSRVNDLQRLSAIHIPPCSYPQDEDTWTLASDGRYWPTGYLLTEVENG